jgi:hypothetical protein
VKGEKSVKGVKGAAGKLRRGSFGFFGAGAKNYLDFKTIKYSNRNWTRHSGEIKKSKFGKEKGNEENTIFN